MGWVQNAAQRAARVCLLGLGEEGRSQRQRSQDVSSSDVGIWPAPPGCPSLLSHLPRPLPRPGCRLAWGPYDLNDGVCQMVCSKDKVRGRMEQAGTLPGARRIETRSSRTDEAMCTERSGEDRARTVWRGEGAAAGRSRGGLGLDGPLEELGPLRRAVGSHDGLLS